MPAFVDLTGRKFGRLLVLNDAGVHRTSGGYGFHRWNCRCECGAEKSILGGALKAGAVVSCGCVQRERVSAANTTHGASKSGEYRAWRHIQARCYNPRANQFADYGGRGITVADCWRGPGGFECFLADVGRKPTPAHTIDRKDNDGNYEPGNVCWATRAEQAVNKRPQGNNKSGFRGVSFFPRDARWEARCKGKFLGYFDTPEAAAHARDAAAVHLLGADAPLNFPM